MHFKTCSKFFFSKLDDNEKRVYEKILDGWFNYKKRIIVVGFNGKVDFQKVFSSLRDDIPELFYIDFNSVSVGFLPCQAIVSANFLYSPEEIDEIKKKIKGKIESFKNSVNKNDIERAVHDYLASNVKYSNDLYAEEAHSVYGAFLNNAAVCEGYARAFKLMCDELDIPCIVVTGVARDSGGQSENHAWNIVRKGKANYHVDVTWNSSLYQNSGTPLYYNVSDDFISKDHTWDKRRWPSCSVSGEIEKEIIDVVGLKSFAESLARMASLKRETFILRFNKKFDSTGDIMSLIQKALQNKALNVASYSASYMSKLDCAIVWFKY